ncbi:MAG: hypothetical protein NZM33_16035 [Bryobacteraceae bacterium]|nr:hypothetical protein [Bryobacteraceae bacterium]
MNPTAAPRYLTYRLTLESPVIVTERQGDPNSAGTRPYVSGSAVRGVVARRLLAAGVQPDSDDFRLFVLSGRVRYLNAYPELENMRALPTPLSWRVRKADPQRGWDLAYLPPKAATVELGDETRRWPEEQLQAVGAPFVSPSLAGDAWLVATPRVKARIHHQRDRVKGRAWKNAEGSRGAIFTYEFLEAGQRLRGVIQLMPEAAGCEAKLRELFSGPTAIGRSRRAGYGAEARVEFLDTLGREYAGAHALLDRGLRRGDRFRILLVSPCLVRDPATGQMDPPAFEKHLRERFPGCFDFDCRCWGFEVAGGFNQKWGLELPQALAVRAGSVWMAHAQRDLPLDELLRLEHEGIGERRSEGFGRLVLLADEEAGEQIRLGVPSRPRPEEPASPPADKADEFLLDLLERRILLEGAETELRRAAWELAEGATGIPSRALLGRIRTLLREGHDEARAAAALAELKKWTADWSNSDKRAAEQLRECRVQGAPLLDLLDSLTGEGANDRVGRLERAVGHQAQLAALSERRYLRTPESARHVLARHGAVLSVVFLDELMNALARKSAER